ncbi:ATP-dependent 6-phosphofructokinase [Fulvivirga sp. RKSG066]|uniref:6-phosphofructokinase n=1 Tax=Fulvivirga aurantia TaxID=2529383 RepID=UPI0012BB4F29|nr:ATP-dependent 6-phosphofructokinase [Fulvivirga aurantia]MTI23239.1 ATP-dependent 6-phosphofructokinase [Fulvivirga aurantia]
MAEKNVLVLTGGGDCPGLNAVIRGIVKSARKKTGWKVLGSIEAFNGILKDPMEVVKLNKKKAAGIHVKGGTILKTTNKGNPFDYPVENSDGTWSTADLSDELLRRIKELNVEAVINIGGDGSQRISQKLHEKGLNIIGVPKTIDNDLSGTDITFGFRTAVQIATDSFDKLVTTAESHHRVMIMEVMGRDAGWIALHTAIAGGAEVCLIPEIPYDVNKVVNHINKRYEKGKGFVNIVVAEGAKPIDGNTFAKASTEAGYEHKRLGGVAYRLSEELKEAGCKADIRETVLGHTQRGGTPIAFDRILATLFGIKAFELVADGDFGKMVAFKNNEITAIPLKEAISEYNYIKTDAYEIKAAKSIGISFGD